MVFRVDEGITAVGCGRAQFIPLLVCALSTMADAFEMILLSFIGPMVRCEMQCTSIEEALLTTLVFVGMIFGGFVWGYLCDHPSVGRRISIIWANTLTFGAGFASAFAPDIWSLIMLRGILGVGIAGNTLVPITLFMESLPPGGRGFWSTICLWSWSIGAVLLVLLAWLILPDYGWRYLVLAASIPGILTLAVSMFFLEESPFFYAMHHKREKARSRLESMALENGSKLPEGELITKSGKKSQKAGADWTAILGTEMRSTTLRLWFVWFSCSLCYYATILVTTMMAKEEDASGGDACKESSGSWTGGETTENVFSEDAYMEILNSTWGEVAAAILAMLLLDRIGRRALIVSAFLTFMICYIIFACTGRDEGHGTTKILKSIVMFCARTAAGIALTPTIYVYTSELYPTTQRAAGLASGYIFARLGGVTAPFIGQTLFEASYESSCITLAAISGVAAIISFSFTVETSGQPLRMH